MKILDPLYQDLLASVLDDDDDDDNCMIKPECEFFLSEILSDLLLYSALSKLTGCTQYVNAKNGLRFI